MCLIFFSYDVHPKYRLVIAANRDEFYDRPTNPLDFWEDAPYILGGRDLKGKGTWLGMTRTGRLGAITNFRDSGAVKTDVPSRGILVSDFLAGDESPEDYLERMQTVGHRYNGFNLLIGDESGLFHYSNRGEGIEKIMPGLYGLSNHLLDTPWPKVVKGKAQLFPLFEKEEIHAENVFQILRDRERPPDKDLPDTGVGLMLERMLSPLFVTSEIYGTRSSSIILVEREGNASFAERTYVPKGENRVEHETRIFSLTPCST